MKILAEFSVCSDFLAEWKTALTFFHHLIRLFIETHVIKSSVKTSVTTYIHTTTYIHVDLYSRKPIFTQVLMIWLGRQKEIII